MQQPKLEARGMVDPHDYLVLDVETNGLKAARDDLLSISIYKPDDGGMYNRFLPLEKQERLNPEATVVNGIKPSDIRGKKPLTQEEVDSLLEDFEMRERTIVTYGGSRGAKGRGFDERFLQQYFDDHHLSGMEGLTFLDFKRMVHSGGNMFFPVTKDNLCRAFGIEGVTETHTSENDCILEWKLFEAMDGRDLLVTGGNVFKLNHDYVIPASYLDRFTGLRAYAGVPKRYVNTKEVFRLELTEDATREFLRFPNNISGMTVEHLIDAEVHAREVDSRKEILENKSKLEYVGSFLGTAEPILVEKRDEGVITLSSKELESAAQSVRDAIGPCELADVLDLSAKKGGSLLDQLIANLEANEQFEELRHSVEHTGLSSRLARILWQSEVVEAAARANRAIKPELGPLADFLKNLLGPEILSQELVINREGGCLALCDLSSERAVVEIKTGVQGYDLSKCVEQLYYQANGRDCYALHVDWGRGGAKNPTRTKFVVEKVTFTTAKPQRRKSDKRRRGYAIRHAVMEWRHSHPEGTSQECAKALWLKMAEVEEAWPKADPDVMFGSVPSRGQKRQTYEKMVSWRREHPEGTRIELSDDEGIPMSDVEKWWYQASMSPFGGTGDTLPPKMDDESIRSNLGDIADESNLYTTWTNGNVIALQERVRALCNRVGIPTAGDNMTLFWPSDYLDDEGRKDRITRLKELEQRCRGEIEAGTRVLRIPLSSTKYKTRTSYMELDPGRARITHEKIRGRRGRNIVITVSLKKQATFKPKDALYATAKELVDKKIVRAYIERQDSEKEGHVVLAVTDEPAPEWVWM
ncbi:MAG: exonuclease domain-containing protein [Atopobiaceae bacterium]